MSLTQALNSAVSGLRVTQSGLALVAANVANAETPGYVRKTQTQVATSAGVAGVSVRVSAVTRELDQYIQRQYLTESSGGAYADTRSDYYARLQATYGAPGSSTALETVYSNFTSSLQDLASSPESTTSRSAVLSSAQVLAQTLNGLTSDIQSLRSDAELSIADSVASANDAMSNIARINQQLGTTNTADTATASLLDQRDLYVSKLTQLMDVKVVEGDHNQINVFTNSGIQLVGAQASTLRFDPAGTITPDAKWTPDAATRTVGTLSLVSPTGADLDLIANKSLRSGKIASLLEFRDQILPEAQAQIDGVAAALASSLSDTTTSGTAASSGAQQGVDLDLGGLLAGNSFKVSYTDASTGKTVNYSFVRVDDPKALPLANTATTDPNDKVVGIDFSGGIASVVAKLNSVLGSSGIQVSNPSGNTVRILDDGATGLIDIKSASVTKTATSFANGTPQLPFFLDANSPYSGAITALGPQSVGLAARITINPALLADPSKLVVYQTSPVTPSGDGTRANFIYNQLNSAKLDFSPATGVGTASTPFSGSIGSFIQQVISQQGQAADAATSLAQGQDIVVQSLQKRLDDTSGVNVDEEMATLLNLQNAYAANARVLSAVRDMLDTLLKS